jgi:hypothetical protein
VGVLASAVDVLLAVPVESMPLSAMAAEMAEIDREQARLAGRKAALLGAFDAAGGAQADGAASTAGWLRQQFRTGVHDAAATVRTARLLRGLPAVAEALSDGEISWAHAIVMAPVLTEVHARLDAATAAGVGSALLHLARTDLVDRLRVATRRVRENLDPDGELAKAEREFERRWMSVVVGSDGLVHVRGLLDAEGGAIFKTALDAATPPPAPGDPRTREQACADAAVDVCRLALRADELPTAAGRRPQLTLTVDLDTLRREEASAGGAAPRLGDLLDPAGVPGTGPEPALVARRLLTSGAQVSWTGPVPAATARRIACDAQVTRLVLDPTGQPLHLGRTRRLVSSAQALALATRDGGCIADGCTHPPQWCDVHHLDHWADGGASDIDRLALVCRFHHRYSHEHDWTVSRGADGRYTLRAPPHHPRR